jgi:hypothetical protein
MIGRRPVSLTSLAALAIVVASCGGSDGNSSSGADEPLDDAGTAALDVDDGTEAGEAAQEAVDEIIDDAGGDLGDIVDERVEGAAPSAWPTDMPIPTGMTIELGVVTNGSPTIDGTADSSPEELYAAYRADVEAAGFTVDSATEGPSNWFFQASKPGLAMAAGIASNPAVEGTSFISVSLYPG